MMQDKLEYLQKRCISKIQELCMFFVYHKASYGETIKEINITIGNYNLQIAKELANRGIKI